VDREINVSTFAEPTPELQLAKLNYLNINLMGSCTFRAMQDSAVKLMWLIIICCQYYLNHMKPLVKSLFHSWLERLVKMRVPLVDSVDSSNQLADHLTVIAAACYGNRDEVIASC